MSYIKTKSGINWYVQSCGNGEALLFVHGWSFDSSIWFKQLESFFNSHKFITLDLPGHGFSDYKNKVEIVEDLHSIVRELKLDKLNLVGHSLGGFISLKFCLKFPELVNKLVLIGAPAKFAKSNDYNFGLEQSEIDKLRNFLSNEYPQILSVFMRWLFTKHERSQSDFRETWHKLSNREIWPKKDALADFLDLIEKEDLIEQLPKLNMPTLIISGTDDSICPVSSIDYLNKRIKNSKVELFKDCGHLSFLTKSQRFNSLVKEFLN